MWKYFSTLIFILLVVMVIGFVRSNYYRRIKNPLHTELQLAANFGELRPDHFHMGLDIRTEGKEDLPVYAIEDGYISRIKIEAAGYGKAVFITHANGFTSLYAHLNNYGPAVEQYIIAQQYKSQRWQQDISFSPGQFPVSKGELIAYSGNTGHSEGPHLHFELRDTKTGNNLNPALYGFVVKDHTPPSILGLYWYDRRYSTYEKGPTAIDITGKDGDYGTKRKIVKVTSPIISLGIRTEDRVDDSRFRYGVFRMQVWMDKELIHDMTMNNFPDSDSRYVNACIDYTARITKGQYIQHLSRLPGNRLPLFGNNNNGLIRLPDNSPHDVLIRVSDIAGNATDLKFVLQKGGIDPVRDPETKLLLPGQSNVVNGAYAVVHFDTRSFYDSVPFVLKEGFTRDRNAVSARINLHNPTVPVHDRYTVSIKTTLKPGSVLRDKTVMQFSGFKNKMLVKGVWEGNSMRGSFNELGKVQLFVDTISPDITTVGWSDDEIFNEEKCRISILANDNMGEIGGFGGTIDDRWVLFEQKGNLFTYVLDKHCPPGKHRLTITATDVAGNKIEKQYSFTRR
jgi:hypothetical protein